MKKHYAILITFLLCMAVYAQAQVTTFSPIASGNWSNASNWLASNTLTTTSNIALTNTSVTVTSSVTGIAIGDILLNSLNATIGTVTGVQAGTINFTGATATQAAGAGALKIQRVPYYSINYGLGASTISSIAGNSITMSAVPSGLAIGDVIYTNNGDKIGNVLQINGSVITTSAAFVNTPTVSSGIIYTHTSDAVNINSGVTVTVDITTASCSNLMLSAASASLVFSNAAAYTLSVYGTLNISNANATIDMSSASNQAHFLNIYGTGAHSNSGTFKGGTSGTVNYCAFAGTQTIFPANGTSYYYNLQIATGAIPSTYATTTPATISGGVIWDPTTAGALPVTTTGLGYAPNQAALNVALTQPSSPDAGGAHATVVTNALGKITSITLANGTARGSNYAAGALTIDPTPATVYNNVVQNGGASISSTSALTTYCSYASASANVVLNGTLTISTGCIFDIGANLFSGSGGVTILGYGRLRFNNANGITTNAGSSFVGLTGTMNLNNSGANNTGFHPNTTTQTVTDLGLPSVMADLVIDANIYLAKNTTIARFLVTNNNLNEKGISGAKFSISLSDHAFLVRKGKYANVTGSNGSVFDADAVLSYGAHVNLIYGFVGDGGVLGEIMPFCSSCPIPGLSSIINVTINKTGALILLEIGSSLQGQQFITSGNFTLINWNYLSVGNGQDVAPPYTFRFQGGITTYPTGGLSVNFYTANFSPPGVTNPKQFMASSFIIEGSGSVVSNNGSNSPQTGQATISASGSVFFSSLIKVNRSSPVAPIISLNGSGNPVYVNKILAPSGTVNIPAGQTLDLVANGYGAQLNATTDGNGTIVALTVDSAGYGYSVGSLVYLFASGSSGNRKVASVSVTSINANGGITGVSILSGGGGYTAGSNFKAFPYKGIVSTTPSSVGDVLPDYYNGNGGTAPITSSDGFTMQSGTSLNIVGDSAANFTMPAGFATSLTSLTVNYTKGVKFQTTFSTASLALTRGKMSIINNNTVTLTGAYATSLTVGTGWVSMIGPNNFFAASSLPTAANTNISIPVGPEGTVSGYRPLTLNSSTGLAGGSNFKLAFLNQNGSPNLTAINIPSSGSCAPGTLNQRENYIVRFNTNISSQVNLSLSANLNLSTEFAPSGAPSAAGTLIYRAPYSQSATLGYPDTTVNLTGTGTFNSGNTLLTGTGTAFNLELVPGSTIRSGGTYIGTVLSVNSPTSVTLTSAGAATSGSNLPLTASWQKIGQSSNSASGNNTVITAPITLFPNDNYLTLASSIAATVCVNSDLPDGPTGNYWWYGATSRNWTTGANWSTTPPPTYTSAGTAYPNSKGDVVVISTPSSSVWSTTAAYIGDPIISSSISVQDIHLSGSLSLTLAAGSSLNVYGNFNRSTTSTLTCSNTSSVAYNANGTQIVAPGTYGNLDVSSSGVSANNVGWGTAFNSTLSSLAYGYTTTIDTSGTVSAPQITIQPNCTLTVSTGAYFHDYSSLTISSGCTINKFYGANGAEPFDQTPSRAPSFSTPINMVYTNNNTSNSLLIGIECPNNTGTGNFTVQGINSTNGVYLPTTKNLTIGGTLNLLSSYLTIGDATNTGTNTLRVNGPINSASGSGRIQTWPNGPAAAYNNLNIGLGPAADSSLGAITMSVANGSNLVTFSSAPSFLLVGTHLVTSTGIYIGKIASITSGTTVTLAANTTAPTNAAYSGSVYLANRYIPAGTITTLTTSRLVTGSSTYFASQISAGMTLYNSSGISIGTVQAVLSNTQLILSANASVALASGSAYLTNIEWLGAGAIITNTLSNIATGFGSSFGTQITNGSPLYAPNGTLIGTTSSINTVLQSVTLTGNSSVTLTKSLYGCLALGVATGTISITNGVATVTGTGTLFQNELASRALLFDPAGNYLGQVTATPSSQTSLTIQPTPSGNYSGNFTYVLARSNYANTPALSSNAIITAGAYDNIVLNRPGQTLTIDQSTSNSTIINTALSVYGGTLSIGFGTLNLGGPNSILAGVTPVLGTTASTLIMSGSNYGVSIPYSISQLKNLTISKGTGSPLNGLGAPIFMASSLNIIQTLTLNGPTATNMLSVGNNTLTTNLWSADQGTPSAKLLTGYQSVLSIGGGQGVTYELNSNNNRLNSLYVNNVSSSGITLSSSSGLTTTHADHLTITNQVNFTTQPLINSLNTGNQTVFLGSGRYNGQLGVTLTATKGSPSITTSLNLTSITGESAKYVNQPLYLANGDFVGYISSVTGTGFTLADNAETGCTSCMFFVPRLPLNGTWTTTTSSSQATGTGATFKSDILYNPNTGDSTGLGQTLYTFDGNPVGVVAAVTYDNELFLTGNASNAQSANANYNLHSGSVVNETSAWAPTAGKDTSSSASNLVSTYIIGRSFALRYVDANSTVGAQNTTFGGLNGSTNLIQMSGGQVTTASNNNFSCLRITGSAAQVTVGGNKSIWRQWELTPQFNPFATSVTSTATTLASFQPTWLPEEDNPYANASFYPSPPNTWRSYSNWVVWRRDDQMDPSPGNWFAYPGHTSYSPLLCPSAGCQPVAKTLIPRAWPSANAVSVTKFSRWTISDNLQPLPVVNIQLTGVVSSNDARLDWTFVGPGKVQQFIVERSFDGSNFGSIATLGGGTDELFYYDAGVFVQNSVAFYRLKAIDATGQSWYSNITRLQTTLYTDITVYPNPVSLSSTIKVVFNSSQPAEGILSFTDVNGVVVSQNNISIQKGRMEQDLAAGEWIKAPGVYMLTVKTNNLTVKRKIVAY